MARFRTRQGFALSAFLLVGSAGVGFWGCDGHRCARQTIRFWAMGREGEAVRELVDDFERLRPDIEVQLQQIPWSAAHEKLLTAYVARSLPDVFQVGTTWVPELHALGALEPLQDRLAQSEVIAADQYFPGALEAATLGSSILGIPWYVDTRLLYYRADLLALAGYSEPPQTWAQWTQTMTRVQARMGTGRHAILLPVGEWEVPVILALQRGAQLLAEDAQWGNFESPPFREAFEFYLSLFRQGLAPRTGLSEISSVYRDFAEGFFCFYVSGPWNIGEFRRRLPPPLEGRWRTAPMPAASGPYPGVSIIGGASLAVSHASERKDVAWAMIEYLAAQEQQVRFYRATGDLPAHRGAWQDAALRDDAIARAFWLQLQHVRVTPRIPEWEQVAQKIAAYAESAIRGSMSSAQALAALDRDVNRLLEKRRWLMRRARVHGADRR